LKKTHKVQLPIQKWKQVIDRLLLNKVTLETISKDTTMEVFCYYIHEYKTSKNPYEGHYSHYDVKTEKNAGIVFKN